MHTLKKLLKRDKYFKEFYNRIYRKYFSTLVRFYPVLASKIFYKNATGKNLNLNNPQDFNEKLQWLKLYWQHPLVVKCADKYEVREYVNECGCGGILNELYEVYNDITEIRWEILPKKFALKTTNGCDTNIICDDKSKLDKDKVLIKLGKWLRIDYGLLYGEIHYSKISPRIICEKYIETDSGVFPNDYKIFCFNGEPKFLYVGVIDETGYTHKTFYDLKWNKLDYLKDGYISYDHEKPSCLDEMIKYASILSKPFPFVRVDFYDYNGKPLFGEMTFTPTGGLATYYKDETLKMLGNMMILPKKL